MDKTPKQTQKDVPHNQTASHVPVLMKEVLEYLDPRLGDRYLDLTGGYGGHTAAVLTLTENPNGAVLVDRDQAAVVALRRQFGEAGITILHQDYLTASQELQKAGRQFDVILADLGVSSMHLNEAERGFSIRNDGPLDMRMDKRQQLTAAGIVNTYSETDLVTLLRGYGEEPKARAIAQAIVRQRPFTSTAELAAVVARVWHGHYKVHPATRTFQALRIAVNNELELLELSLPLWISLLAPGGRLAVISFHSLEDRLVKQAFQERSGQRYDAELELLAKRPITPGRDELAFNPRARSAKLRAAAKINNKGKGSA